METRLLQGRPRFPKNLFCISSAPVRWSKGSAYSNLRAGVLLEVDPDNGRSVVPLYIRFSSTPGSATTTLWWGSILIDSVHRYDTGGTSALPANNRHSGISTTSCVSRFHVHDDPLGTGVGDLLVTAPTSTTRNVSRVTLSQGVVGLQGQSHILAFSQSVMSLSASSTQSVLTVVAPVVLPPGASMAIHDSLIAAPATAPTLEIEACWYEK